MNSEQWLPCEVLCAFAWLDHTCDRAETSPVGAPWCLYLQSGLLFILFIFFFLKIDFSSGAFAIVLFRCCGCPRWEVWPCEAPWWLSSIGRGGFCSDLPRCAFLLNLKIRFRFTVLFYIVCYVLLHLERDFTLFFCLISRACLL